MPIDVLTNRNDNRRSSTYLNETVLSPKNVNANEFGKLFDRTVDGDVYAQPLIVSGLELPKKGRREASKRNVVYVATTRNWVYAFDADDPLESEPLWARQLGTPIPREDFTRVLGGGNRLLNFSSELGIVSTPVIRRSVDGGTIFVIARSRRPRYDVLVVPPVSKVAEIAPPRVAKKVVVLTKVGTSLYVRIYDGAGKVVHEADEAGLIGPGPPTDDQAKAKAEIKAHIEKFQAHENHRPAFTSADRSHLINLLGSILGKVPNARKADEDLFPEYFAKIHALDVRTGIEIGESTIETSVTGSLGQVVEFDPFMQLNRPGLLLVQDGKDPAKDVVYSAWSSQGDAQPFYGWVLAHDAKTLKLLATHCTTPDWGEGGIWQSGTGLGADDEGFVYYVSGNGASDFDHGKGRYLPILPILPLSPDELDGYDLILLPTMDGFDQLATGAKPGDGNGLVVVANVGTLLRFFVFDRDWKMVLGGDGKHLAGQAKAIEQLKNQLDGVWEKGPLTETENKSIIKAIKPIVAATLGKTVAAPGFGCSIVKLKLARAAKAPERVTFEVIDWFTPANTTAGFELVEGTPAAPLNDHDFDLCAGPVLFRAKDADGVPLDLVVGGGKNGRLYVLNRDDMGHWAKPDGSVPGKNSDAVIQEERLCHYHVHGAPVFWEGSLREAEHGAVFVWSEEDHLRAYAWNKGARKFDSRPFAISEFGFGSGEMLMPGGFLAISADGTDPFSAIIWASHPTEDAINATVPGVLRAFDASTTVTKGNHTFFKELWNSNHDPLHADRVGMFAKYNPPVVANGKVYLATFSRQLVVYGELPDAKQPNSNGPMMGMDMHHGMDMDRSQPDPGPAPNTFYAQTVGKVEVNGSFAGNCEKLILLSAGYDVGGASDEFQFYGQIRDGSGPVEVIALVHTIQDDDPDTKAGVMIRVSPGNDKPFENRLVSGSPHASMLITSDGRPMFVWRASANATSRVMQLASTHQVPYFVKVRSEPVPGLAFYELSGSISSDGIGWQPVGNPVRIAAPTPKVFDNGTKEVIYLQAGVVLAAHDEPTKTLDDLRTAMFRELEITDLKIDQD